MYIISISFLFYISARIPVASSVALTGGMSQQFRNAGTRKTMRIMLGNMYPSEMADLSLDRQVQRFNIPWWIEETLQEECKIVVARLPRYEEKIRSKYGILESLAEKLTVYHTVWDDWDSLEPCKFHQMRSLRYYFDEHIDPIVKKRILEATQLQHR